MSNSLTGVLVGAAAVGLPALWWFSTQTKPKSSAKAGKKPTAPFSSSDCSTLATDAAVSRWLDEQVGPLLDEEIRVAVPQFTIEGDNAHAKNFGVMADAVERILSRTLGGCYRANTQAYGSVWKTVWCAMLMRMVEQRLVDEEPEDVAAMCSDPNFDPRTMAVPVPQPGGQFGDVPLPVEPVPDPTLPGMDGAVQPTEPVPAVGSDVVTTPDGVPVGPDGAPLWPELPEPSDDANGDTASALPRNYVRLNTEELLKNFTVKRFLTPNQPVRVAVGRAVLLAYHPQWFQAQAMREKLLEHARRRPDILFLEASVLRTSALFGTPKNPHQYAYMVTAAGPTKVSMENAFTGYAHSAPLSDFQWGLILAAAAGQSVPTAMTRPRAATAIARRRPSAMPVRTVGELVKIVRLRGVAPPSPAKPKRRRRKGMR